MFGNEQTKALEAANLFDVNTGARRTPARKHGRRGMGLLSLEHSEAACRAGLAWHGVAVVGSLSPAGPVIPEAWVGCADLPGASR